ncbi:MAG: DUF456 domain-containing protein [Bacteroidales bacterium]|nr:DUF456 domain-containing protein [Candidatus Cacconaster merdequi]
MTILAILAVIAGIIGIIGSIMPGLPGPPVSWAGILLVYLAGGTGRSGEPMTLAFVLIWLAVTVIVTVLDYIVPAYFTKLTGGSRYAGRGAIAGLLIGLIVPPVGMILGSLLGAFGAELLFNGSSVGHSVKASLGAFLGFLSGTGVKLIASAIMMYYIIVFL